MGMSGSRGIRVSNDMDDARASDSDEDDGKESSIGCMPLSSVLLLCAFLALLCKVLHHLGVVGPYAHVSYPSPFWGCFFAIIFLSTLSCIANCTFLDEERSFCCC